MAAHRFEAEVEAEDDRLFVVVPDAVVAAVGRGRRPPLAIEVNGYRYRSTPAVYGGRTYLGFRREVREAAGLRAGLRVAVTMEPEDEPREVTVPVDLEAALRAEPTVEAAFAALSFTQRKEYVAWVESAKRDETRRRRIERTMTNLRPGPKDTQGVEHLGSGVRALAFAGVAVVAVVMAGFAHLGRWTEMRLPGSAVS